MYRCTWCGAVFPEEHAAVKVLPLRIHGEEETEDIDTCPFCFSEEIVDYEEEEEEKDGSEAG